MIRLINNDATQELAEAPRETSLLRPPAPNPTTAVSLENIHDERRGSLPPSAAVSPVLTVFHDEDDEEEGDAAFLLSSLITNSALSEPLLVEEDLPGFEAAFASATPTEFTTEKTQYFLLSSGGKPIYLYHGTNEQITSYMGIIQTLTAFYQDDELDCLQSLTTANGVTFTLLNQSPVILMAVSSTGDSLEVLARQLHFLYSFILSIFTKPFLTRSFALRANFNLQNHLTPRDVRALTLLCDTFTNRTEASLPFLTSSVEYFYLKRSVRLRLNEALLALKDLRLSEDPTDPNNILYGLLVAPHGKLISILRPRNRSLHTTDLQLLFKMVFGLDTRATDDAQEEFWVPICLPKFNASGFLHAYIRYLRVDNRPVVVILLSASKHAFFEMKQYATHLVTRLAHPKIAPGLGEALRIAQEGLSSALVHNSNVLHFLYLSKKHLQHLSSRFPQSQPLRHTIARFYHALKAALDAEVSSPTEDGTRLVFKKWQCGKEHMVGFGLANASFEIYALVPHTHGGGVRKDLIMHNVMGIVQWCDRNEERLFVVHGAVF